jgi:vitamin B12 transporter
MLKTVLPALLLIAGSSFAQVISGVIEDPKGAVVPGAKVTFAGQTSASAISGSDGRYRLEPVSGSGTLTVALEGFRSSSRTLSTVTGSVTEDFRLELDIASDSITVTSRGTAISLEEAGVSASVFTEEDLKVRNFNRVADVLRDVPGLNLVQTGSNGGVTSIFGRGGDSNAMLVMIDGIPVTDPGGALNVVGLSTPGLERVEVVRGPQSSLYGAEAASGVIQMYTKHGDPEATIPHGEISYERGSFSTDHWTAALNGGFLKRFDYALTTDQYRSTGQYPNNAFRSTTGTGSLGFKISNKTNIRGLFREFDSFTGAPGSTAFQAYNLDANSRDRDSVVGVRLDDVRSDRFTQHVTFGYHRLRSAFSDILPESYQKSALVEDRPGLGTFFVRLVPEGSTPDAGTRLVSTTFTTFPGTSLSITDRTSAGYQATMSHTGGTLVAGYDFERQSGLITGNNVDRRTNGLSIFDQYAWRNRIFVSVGARYEHSSIFGHRFAPRGAITFRLPTDTYLRLSLGRGIKQPTLLESFARTSSYAGNPNLRPAKTDTFEAGLTRDWFGGRVHTDAAYFRNKFSDLIQYVSGPAPAFFGGFQNVSRAWSRGVELNGAVKLHSFVTARLTYTRLSSQITASATTSDVGQQLLRRAKNSGTASLEFTPRRWSAIIGARFVGNSRDSFASFGITRISAYNTVYLSMSYQATKYITPFFRINNLTDEQYREVSGYGAWSRNGLGGVRVTW